MAKRVGLIWLIGVTVAALVVVAVVAYTRVQPLAVSVATLEKDVPIQVFGLGTIEAQTVSRIGFETAGTLIELKADHGDTVKAGTLLARLHSHEQEAHTAQARAAVTQAAASVDQAQSAVEKAEAVLKQKGGVSERRHQLVERGVVSQETAEDTLSAAAPYDAIVMTRHRELGSALNANETVFTLVDPATIWALAYIDEVRARAGSPDPRRVFRATAHDRPRADAGHDAAVS